MFNALRENRNLLIIEMHIGTSMLRVPVLCYNVAMDNGVITNTATVVLGLITAALAGGLLTGFVNYTQNQRARRRRVIAEAVEIAFDRVEMLYKVRRRPINATLLAQDEVNIRDDMHRIQSKTEYYITILSSESAWLGSCYEKLINEIKRQTEPLLQEAWGQKPKGVGIKLKGAGHPDLKNARRQFILEILRYFNPLKRIYFASMFRLRRFIHHG